MNCCSFAQYSAKSAPKLLAIFNYFKNYWNVDLVQIHIFSLYIAYSSSVISEILFSFLGYHLTSPCDLALTNLSFDLKPYFSTTSSGVTLSEVDNCLIADLKFSKSGFNEMIVSRLVSTGVFTSSI
jgi:hypothetical protein